MCHGLVTDKDINSNPDIWTLLFRMLPFLRCPMNHEIWVFTTPSFTCPHGHLNGRRLPRLDRCPQCAAAQGYTSTVAPQPQVQDQWQTSSQPSMAFTGNQYNRAASNITLPTVQHSTYIQHAFSYNNAMYQPPGYATNVPADMPSYQYNPNYPASLPAAPNQVHNRGTTDRSDMLSSYQYNPSLGPSSSPAGNRVHNSGTADRSITPSYRYNPNYPSSLPAATHRIHDRGSTNRSDTLSYQYNPNFQPSYAPAGNRIYNRAIADSNDTSSCPLQNQLLGDVAPNSVGDFSMLPSSDPPPPQQTTPMIPFTTEYTLGFSKRPLELLLQQPVVPHYPSPVAPSAFDPFDSSIPQSFPSVPLFDQPDPTLPEQLAEQQRYFTALFNSEPSTLPSLAPPTIESTDLPFYNPMASSASSALSAETPHSPLPSLASATSSASASSTSTSTLPPLPLDCTNCHRRRYSGDPAFPCDRAQPHCSNCVRLMNYGGCIYLPTSSTCRECMRSKSRVICDGGMPCQACELQGRRLRGRCNVSRVRLGKHRQKERMARDGVYAESTRGRMRQMNRLAAMSEEEKLSTGEEVIEDLQRERRVQERKDRERARRGEGEAEEGEKDWDETREGEEVVIEEEVVEEEERDGENQYGFGGAWESRE
jgi:hypothetical protein